jgi:hypothetical protein
MYVPNACYDMIRNVAVRRIAIFLLSLSFHCFIQVLGVVDFFRE